jgi:hypothetical protein
MVDFLEVEDDDDEGLVMEDSRWLEVAGKIGYGG